MEIRVNIPELLTILAKNREQHEIDYKEAVEKYLSLVSRQASMININAAEALSSFKTKTQFWTFPDTYISAPKPEKFLAEYDRAIKMLKMHVEPTILLSEKQYKNFIDDEWQWSQHFASNTLSYKG